MKLSKEEKARRAYKRRFWRLTYKLFEIARQIRLRNRDLDDTIAALDAATEAELKRKPFH